MCLTSWLGILLIREAGGVPVRRIICCSWFMSIASKSRGIITLRSACQRARDGLGSFLMGGGGGGTKRYKMEEDYNLM